MSNNSENRTVKELTEDINTVLLLPEENLVDSIGDLFEEIVEFEEEFELKTLFVSKVLEFLLQQNPNQMPMVVYLTSLIGVMIDCGAEVDRFAPEFVEMMRRCVVFLNRELDLIKFEAAKKRGEDPDPLKTDWDGHNEAHVAEDGIILSMLSQLQDTTYAGLSRSEKARVIAHADEELTESVTSLKSQFPKLHSVCVAK